MQNTNINRLNKNTQIRTMPHSVKIKFQANANMCKEEASVQDKD